MTSSEESSTQFQRLFVLIAVSAVDMLGFAMVLPLLPFYALQLRATPETIGWIISSFSIAQLVSAPLWGRLSDRSGRRPALMIGLGASAIAYAVFGLAGTVWLLFLSRVVQGLGGGTTGVAQAYVADVIEPEGRARALGWLSAATAAGVMIGPVVGSLASHLEREAPGFVAATLCLANVFIAWRWLPESRAAAQAHDGKRKPVWHAAWTTLRHPTAPVSRMIWIYSVGMLAFTMLTGVLALYLGARFGIDEKTIGWFFLYVGLLGFVMRSVLLGPIVRKIGEIGAVRAGTLLLVVGLLLYPLPNSILLLAIVIPLVPIGTALLFPSTTSLMSRFSAKSETGTTLGVAQTFAGLARVVAPLLATSLFQRAGHGSPFLVAAGIVAVVGVMAFRFAEPAPIDPVPIQTAEG